MKPTKRHERVGPSAPTDAVTRRFRKNLHGGWFKGGRVRLWRRLNPPLAVRVKTNTRYNADAPIRDPDNPPKARRRYRAKDGTFMPMY